MEQRQDWKTGPCDPKAVFLPEFPRTPVQTLPGQDAPARSLVRSQLWPFHQLPTHLGLVPGLDFVAATILVLM